MSRVHETLVFISWVFTCIPAPDTSPQPTSSRYNRRQTHAASAPLVALALALALALAQPQPQPKPPPALLPRTHGRADARRPGGFGRAADHTVPALEVRPHALEDDPAAALLASLSQVCPCSCPCSWRDCAKMVTVHRRQAASSCPKCESCQQRAIHCCCGWPSRPSRFGRVISD